MPGAPLFVVTNLVNESTRSTTSLNKLILGENGEREQNNLQNDRAQLESHLNESALLQNDWQTPSTILESSTHIADCTIVAIVIFGNAIFGNAIC